MNRSSSNRVRGTLAGQRSTYAPPTRKTGQKTEVQKPTKKIRKSKLFPGYYRPRPEETIFEWVADSRPFVKHSRQWYTKAISFIILICLITFFLQIYLGVLVIIAFSVMVYALYGVVPDKVTNKITTYGLHTGKEFYIWEELGRFWFEDKFGKRVLKIETVRFPNRIDLLLEGITEKQMDAILSEVLLKEKPEPTTFDKAASWLQENIKFEG